MSRDAMGLKALPEQTLELIVHDWRWFPNATRAFELLAEKIFRVGASFLV